MGSLRRPSLVAAAALFATAGACGSGGGGADAGPFPDAACVDPGALPTPVGRFGSPDDFDRDDCTPGALADFEPDGLWYIELEDQGPFRGGPVRLTLGCAGLSVVRGGLAGPGSDADYARLDADDLFWRNHIAFDGGTYVEAFDLCRVEQDGSLSGQAGYCLERDGDETCWTEGLRLSRYERLPGEGEAEGLELLSEWSGAPGFPWNPRAFTANVRVRDGVAYVVTGSDALYVLDVSDPAQPAHLGRLAAGDDDFNDVKIVDGPDDRRFALIASAARGVLSVEVTDPTDPTVVAAFSPNSAPGHGVHTLFIEQRGATTLAYLADGFSRLLTIFDVTDPSAPAQVGSHLLPENRWGIHDLYVEDEHVYLNATWGGLVVLDASNVQVPIQLGRYADGSYSHSNWVTTAGGRKVSATGGEGYDAHLVIVDVDDPESSDFMQPLGSFQTRPQASIHNIMAFGERVYAAWYQDGVRVIDISDPAAPAQVAYFNTWSPETAPGAFLEGAAGIDVDPELGLIYVADTRGLLILREVDR